jgi:membrane associated rhomboid family serine protease
MTIWIILLTAVVSIMAFYNENLMHKLIFNPYSIEKRREWYRFLSSGLIHADWMHLLINMFVLFSFGRVVEAYYDYLFIDKGWYYYIILYIGGMVAAIIPTFYKHRLDPGYSALGASGAVSAIVFASIVLDPIQKLYLFGVIGIPGIVFGPLYLIYSYYQDKRSMGTVNHGAHFWGAIFGTGFTLLLNPSLALHFYYKLVGGYE